MQQNSKSSIISTIVVFILLVIGLGLLQIHKPIVHAPVVETPATTTEIVSERMTIKGTYVTCLPLHDNFSKKQCVAGVKSDDGSYYALDFTNLSATKPSYKEGSVFMGSGIYTPVQMLSSDNMYETVAQGIFSVTDIPAVDPVVPATPTKPTGGKESATGKCYVGGCSGQICSGQPDAISTCEYREEYACYMKAKCERQAETGKCGWTPSAALTSCLMSASPAL